MGIEVSNLIHVTPSLGKKWRKTQAQKPPRLQEPRCIPNGRLSHPCGPVPMWKLTFWNHVLFGIPDGQIKEPNHQTEGSGLNYDHLRHFREGMWNSKFLNESRRETQNWYVPDGHRNGLLWLLWLLSSPPNVAVTLKEMLGLWKAIIIEHYKTFSLWNVYDIWN